MRHDPISRLFRHRYPYAILLSFLCMAVPLFFYYIYCCISDAAIVISPAMVALSALCFVCYTLVFLYVLDHAARKSARQEILIAEHEKKLAEAEVEKMRANLLRAVSHDLRTPLTGIIGNCYAYLENGSFLQQSEKDELVKNISEDSTWLLHMVENLLTVTRIRGSNLSISTTEESVEEIIGEALQKLQSRHPGFEIHVSVPEEFLWIPMDAILIEQVMINLLENAYFHSGTHLPVDLIVTNSPDHVSFTVRDYGTGIPDAQLEHLFDGAGYTNNVPDAQKGMGIGLTICKTIIAAHNGTLIGRNHDKGAEFIFTLPKKKAGTYERKDSDTAHRG